MGFLDPKVYYGIYKYGNMLFQSNTQVLAAFLIKMLTKYIFLLLSVKGIQKELQISMKISIRFTSAEFHFILFLTF